MTNEVSRSIFFRFLSSKLASTTWSSKSKEMLLSVSVVSASNWLEICFATTSSSLVLPAPVWIWMFFIILSAQWDLPSTFGSSHFAIKSGSLLVVEVKCETFSSNWTFPSPWTLLKKFFFFYLKNDHHSCYMSIVFFCYLRLSLPITVLVKLVRDKTYIWVESKEAVLQLTKSFI